MIRIEILNDKILNMKFIIEIPQINLNNYVGNHN